jgi:hypothetical protein
LEERSRERPTTTTRLVRIPSAGSRRIEVTVLRDESGRREVLLQDLSYARGIGWYPQKTIRLDPEQADALLKALCSAREPTSCSGQLRSSPPARRSAEPGHAKIVYLDPPRRS